jgi:hypothetical protein
MDALGYSYFCMGMGLSESFERSTDFPEAVEI